MASILSIKNVTKKFGGLTAVNDLSLEMEEGTIHALIGPNGSGKTTVINLISGILHQNKGEIHFKNETLNGQPTFKRARRGVGRTFQNIKLFPSMSALDNILVGAHAYTKIGIVEFMFNLRGSAREEARIVQEAEKVLQFIGLADVKDELVKNLPYGKQKKVEIGRALLGNPKLLLLDEPAAGLNPAERVDLVALLKKMFENGIQLFLVEHNMDVVMNISRKISVLNFGVKIAEGRPEEIQNNPDVIKAYLGNKQRG